MAVSGLSAPDPYVLDDLIAPGHNATGGLTPRSLVINPAFRTLVLVTSGQSLLCNTNPTLFTPANNTVIDNFNIYDGVAYPISGALLGATNSIPVGLLGPGNLSARVADLLIASGIWNRVILVPIGVGGTFIVDWSAGHLSTPGVGGRFGVAMRRLAARGIAPATTGVTFANLFGLGETDSANGTSSAAWQASFATLMANNVSAGFSGKTFVNLETLTAGATNSTIRAAQAAVVNGTTIFQGGDLDTLTGGTNRQVDGTHLTDSGAASAATLIYNAMHASGAPY